MGAYRSANATVSAHGAVAVTPNDSTIIPETRALFVGTGGNLNVRMVDGMTLVFTNVPAGVFPIQVAQVLSTSTTATNIIALY